MNTKLLTAPFAGVIKLATINVYQNDQLISSIDIEDEVKIEEASPVQRFFYWVKSLFGLLSSAPDTVKTYPLQ